MTKRKGTVPFTVEITQPYPEYSSHWRVMYGGIHLCNIFYKPDTKKWHWQNSFVKESDVAYRSKNEAVRGFLLWALFDANHKQDKTKKASY